MPRPATGLIGSSTSSSIHRPVAKVASGMPDSDGRGWYLVLSNDCLRVLDNRRFENVAGRVRDAVGPDPFVEDADLLDVFWAIESGGDRGDDRADDELSVSASAA